VHAAGARESHLGVCQRISSVLLLLLYCCCFTTAALLLLHQADSRCTPQELANLIWAFAKADFPMTTLLEEVQQQPAVVKQ
jgi:hypothetical protein